MPANLAGGMGERLEGFDLTASLASSSAAQELSQERIHEIGSLLMDVVARFWNDLEP